MYGYKISFKGIPEIKFACSVSVDNYNWKNGQGENHLEISISRADKRFVTINDKESVVTDTEVLSCLPGKEKRSSFCEPGTVCEITSFAVRFEKTDCICTELSRVDADDNSVYLLPAMMSDFSGFSEVKALINKIISCNVSGTASDRAMCISVFFEIVSIIDTAVRKKLLSAKIKGENYYVRKLNYIIDRDYAKKLELYEIAKEFGINPAYLSSVYSGMSGRSFKKALAEKRISKAKELIVEEKLCTEDIARMCGFCDAFYLRKCFKKHFGVSISEYIKISKGLSLYHEKPVRK